MRKTKVIVSSPQPTPSPDGRSESLRSACQPKTGDDGAADRQITHKIRRPQRGIEPVIFPAVVENPYDCTRT
ncbi:hypothetical protein PoB_003680100 [Plakobranchus ocellatus]|uniref:Uncharacterized protein n=1 Tax=Plakobranchus ocellatus TaxID=259542 RepID=A0AAV4AQ53_9GAST|nr:hypothetical protein PoB_003680100 [Plakobranchus ocellatus]